MGNATASLPHPSGPAIRAARKRRVRAIRHWVVAGAVTLFVAVWLLIAVVLVSGHDPALSKTSSAAASTGSVSSGGSSQSSSGQITTRSS